ncbi:hypothetical protein [Allomuricauda sp. M10]|jgi:hypothetical protein|uniref:hypothetical protein n=1 Tax=Allomuricauda sp. M10 TaxID=2683292 RepID=UPI001D196499|nr:hypothetical protein [Muricauda sp. M10]
MTFQEFLKLLWSQFFMLLYLVTWIISVYRYRRFFDTQLKYFPMLVMYTFFTELLGYFIMYNDDFQFFSDGRYQLNNVIIYNLYQLVFFIFFFEVYRKTFKNRFLRKLTLYLTLLCTASYVINAMLVNPLINQMTYAHIIGSILLVLIIFFYLKEKKSETDAPSLKHNLLFWVSIGLLAFYVTFPTILILYRIKLDLRFLVYLRPALVTSIAVMYGLIIFGLLTGQRKAFR